MDVSIQHHIFDFSAGIIAFCSVLHTFLPPWDFLNDFPRAQKYYKAFVYLVGYIAINGRSTLYKQISISNPNGPNVSVATASNGKVVVPESGTKPVQ